MHDNTLEDIKERKIVSFDQADSIFEEIKKAKKILMHCHPNADADSLGSTLGLRHALQSVFEDKEISILKGDTDMPAYLAALPGYSEIVQKNIFETDLGSFDLFLILDSGALNQISKLGEVKFPKNLRTIAIDHHASNTGYADINLVDTSYPATAQIVYELLKKWRIEIPQDTALCLFAGIYSDTGGFRYPSTSWKTLSAAAELARIAPNFPELLFSFQNNNTKGRIMVEGLLLTSVETFFSDSVAIAAVSYGTLQKNGITSEEATGLDVANTLKSVTGWNIGISAVEKEPGIVKVSFRSRDAKNFDVNKIAGILGGGGHTAAAGAQLSGTIEDAKKAIVSAIGQAYPDLEA